MDSEVNVDAALVGRLISDQFPHWAALRLRPVEPVGTVNSMFRLGDDMVVRLTRLPDDSDVDYEVGWLRCLAPRLPIPIPEVLAVGQPGHGYPWQWSVLKWLPGRTWELEGLEDPRAAASQLADFLGALQAVDPATLGGPSPAPLNPISDRDHIVRAAAATLDGSIDEGAFIEAWEDALRVPAWEGPGVLLHWDLFPGNVLVRDGRLAAVIDWAAVSFGDPARDLMAAWTLLSGDARAVFCASMGFDDATWKRARAWLLTGVVGVAHYAKRDPARSAVAAADLNKVLAEWR